MITSVRWRILTLVTLAVATALGATVNFREAYVERLQITENQLESQHLESLAWQLTLEKNRKDIWDEINEMQNRLKPESRREPVIRVLEAAKERPSGLRAKVEFLQQSEQEYRKYITARLPYWSQRLAYFSTVLLSTFVLGLMILVFYLRASIFNPLQELSRKMTDFLNDRYTYQFTVPSPNEIGHLQATFNSLAQRVLRNMEELTMLDNAKSEFLSIASHELRTPLTSIKGSLSLMKSGVVGDMNEMAQNLLNIAETETDRLIRLINELLDLAKIEAGKFEVHKDWVSLNEIVDRTFQSLHGLASQAKVSLVNKSTLSVKIMADRDRIQQVLTNLLSNAIKFSPEGKPVEVATDFNDQNHLVILVRDHGRGIHPDDQAAIFQKFRQASSPKNPLVKGTGLGLAIAKALVEEHKGEIGVTSKPDEGSTFFFTLPQWQFAKESNEDLNSTTGVAA